VSASAGVFGILALCCASDGEGCKTFGLSLQISSGLSALAVVGRWVSGFSSVRRLAYGWSRASGSVLLALAGVFKAAASVVAAIAWVRRRDECERDFGFVSGCRSCFAGCRVLPCLRLTGSSFREDEGHRRRGLAISVGRCRAYEGSKTSKSTI
jgi:hypothetical protein